VEGIRPAVHSRSETNENEEDDLGWMLHGAGL
jgi:hypothetical protein